MKKLANKEQFIEMRASGSSYQAIATELKVSKQTVIDWSKDFSLEIQNLKAIHLESIYQRHLMTAQGRIQLIGEQIERVRGEVLSRSLADVPTEKLYDIMLKLVDAQNKEREKLTFKHEKNFYSYDARKDTQEIAI